MNVLKVDRFGINKRDVITLLSWAREDQEPGLRAAHALTFPTFDVMWAILKAPDTFAFKATDMNSGEMVGYAELSKVNKANGTATLCRVLIPGMRRGQGIATHLLDNVCEFAFNGLALRRVDLLVFTFNAPAIRVYKNLGFRNSGMFREWLYLGNNEYCDAIYMDLLKREFV